MPLKKVISIGKEEADASSYLECIALKVQELEGIILDAEDVSAMKTLKFDLRNVYERAKEKATVGRAEKQVAVGQKTRKPSPGADGASKTSRGVSASARARVGTRKPVEDLHCVPDDLFAEFEYRP